MLVAKRFTLLHNVNADLRVNYAVPTEPVRVAALLIKDHEFEANPVLIHHRTVFLEDKMHDWYWRAGIFRYSGCVREQPGTLVLVEEEIEQEFCPTCRAFVQDCDHKRKK